MISFQDFSVTVAVCDLNKMSTFLMEGLHAVSVIVFYLFCQFLCFFLFLFCCCLVYVYVVFLFTECTQKYGCSLVVSIMDQRNRLLESQSQQTELCDTCWRHSLVNLQSHCLLIKIHFINIAVIFLFCCRITGQSCSTITK